MEYAIDGGEWQILSPADGICDDLVESFTSSCPRWRPGRTRSTVRAWDSADNVGAASHHDQVAGQMTGAGDDAAGLPPAPEVVQIEVGLLQNFCEILYCPDTRVAAIVDPAWEVDRLLREAERLRPEGRAGADHAHPQRSHRGRRRAGARRRAPRVVVNPREAERVRARRAHAGRRDRRPRRRHRAARRARARDARPHRGRHLLPRRRLRRHRRRAVRGRLRPHRLPGRRHAPRCGRACSG